MNATSQLMRAASAATEPCTDSPWACLGDKIGDAIDSGKGIVDSATAGADFLSDPAGNTFRTLQGSAHSLAESVIPAVSGATMPDLTVDWFLGAYKVSFALALLLAVGLLLIQVIQTGRGREGQSGAQLASTIFVWFPLFLGGAIFGPMIGWLLISFFGALTDSLVAWGVAGSADQATATMSGMLERQDASGLAGGSVLGSLLMVCMIAGLALVLFMLVVQMVTLYLTGALIPLALAWWIDPKRRHLAAKLLAVWLLVLASHPLLFFLLGLVWRMTAAQIGMFETFPTLHDTVMLIATILALLLAGFSPFLLLRMAGSLAPGLAGAGGINSGHFGGSGDRTTGAPTLSDVPQDYAPSNVTPPQKQAPNMPDKGSTDPHKAPSPSGSPGGGGLEKPPIGGTGGASGAAGGGGVAGGGAGAAAGGAEGGAAAGEALAGAGAAESGTGVGAIIGIPTLIAGATVAGAAAATDAAQKAAGVAGDAVLDDIEGFGSGGLTGD